MSKIQKLPVEVYEKIKAGEVVEDPASVVRELLDNSVDAGSTKIFLDIEEGGISKILIRDNGEGMNSEDLQKCTLQHTTSKIRKFDDIFELTTAGFRGEALSSVARVSRLKIVSSDNDSGMGMAVFVENGQIIKESAEAHPKGTSVEVNHLFFNVPVRKNFLKSPVSEGKKIKQEVITKALAYPDVHFQLQVNKKSVLNLQAASWEQRIQDIFETKMNFLPFTSRSEAVSVKGVITDLNTTFNSSGKLYFFLNNKYIRPRFLYGVVNSVFSSLIPRGRYPAGAIFIYTDPKHINPNVHPSKKEIKIFIEDKIYKQVYSVLKKLFYPDKEKVDNNSNHKSVHQRFSAGGHQPKKFDKVFHTKEVQPELSFGNSNRPEANEAPNKVDEIAIPHFQYLGSLFKTYLVVEMGEEAWYIDFHAAHERKRYEKLRDLSEKQATQMLLSPRIFHFSKDETARITKNQEAIEAIGFSFYAFGDDAIAVNGIPSFYGEKNWEDDFKDICFTIHKKNISPATLQDDLLKSTACRGSYMSGESIPDEEAKLLIKEILQNSFPLSCPHGRPFIYKMEKKDLASHFLRQE